MASSNHVFQQAFLEPFSTPKMQALAKEIWNFVLYLQESRKPREERVKESDAAYLCHRFIPDMGSLQLLSDGEFGESDIFDNANLQSIRQTLAVMPRRTPWLTVSSRENEAETIIQAIQDQQIFMHRKARTRRNFQRHIKQKIVRGRSALYWEWREETVWRRIVDGVENKKALKQWLKRAGMTQKDAEKMTNGRYPHIISSGPVLHPIDWYDLWVSPAADIVNHRTPAQAIRRFRVLEDLMAERDNLTNKPKYDPAILKDIKPYPIEDLLNSSDHAGGRAGSGRLFGNEGMRSGASNLKYVPVYIVYFPHFQFDFEGTKYDYWDTYFHIALSAAGNSVQLIYAEENPSDLGRSHILIDDAIDWFTPWQSGGIGYVENQVSRYNQKNLLQLLMVTGAAHSIIPAQLAMGMGFRDDEEISFRPGEITIVEENPFGLDVLRPVHTPQQGAMFGEQLLRFYGDDLRASAGLDGLGADNPARSLSKPKTATEINRDATTGSLLLDNQAENDSELLTDLCQAIFEESQIRLLPNRDGMLEYERYLGDRVMQGKLSITDFKVPRSIQVLGVEGAANRDQEMSNMMQGLDISSRVATVNPAAVPFMMQAMVHIWRKLNIPMPEQLEQTALMPPPMMPGDPGMDPTMQNIPPEMMQQFMGEMSGPFGGTTAAA